MNAWIGPVLSLLLLSLVAGALFRYAPPSVKLHSISDLALSLALLSVGMGCQYFLWHLVVAAVAPGISSRMTFRSHALMIWSKYVPGKVWSILGRAGLLARTSGRPLPVLVGASTTAQVIMIVTGIACGISFLALVGEEMFFAQGIRIEMVLVTVAVAAIVLTTFLWWRGVDWKHGGARLAVATLVSTGAWLAWGSGLVHLVQAVGLTGQYWREIGSFAMAATAGILAVVTPGGLGVREGALSVLLPMYGMAAGSAATVALLARLWFALGEALVFLVGLALRHDRPG